MDYGYIKKNLRHVEAEIEAAALRSGREKALLLPVTKGATDEEVLALLALGCRRIAENRTNLFCHRRDLARAAGYDPEMHLIGSLQTNKVKYIAEDAFLIHSLDSLSLAKEIEKQAAKCGREIPVLIEVNSGREPMKGGVMPEEADAFAASLLNFPHVALYGVMTMAPALESEEAYRPYFRETRAFFERLMALGAYKTKNPILSMGMSDSYRVAVEEGATIVRVGTSLFRKGE